MGPFSKPHWIFFSVDDAEWHLQNVANMGE